MTGEDLRCTPSAIEQGKFEYSPLGKIFNRGLDEDDQKKGLFTVEHDKDVDQKTIKQHVFDYLKRSSQEAKDMMDGIEDVKKDINVRKSLLLLVVTGKNLTLTSLGCHKIFFQVFIMVKLH